MLGKPTFTGVVARAGSCEYSREEVRSWLWGNTGDQGSQEKSRVPVPGLRSCCVIVKEKGRFLCKNIYGIGAYWLTAIVTEG